MNISGLLGYRESPGGRMQHVCESISKTAVQGKLGSVMRTSSLCNDCSTSE